MALIVAAGRGLRAGGGVPKQYRDLGGCMVLTRTLRAMAGHDAVARVTVAIHLDDAAHYQRAVSALEPALRANARMRGGVGGAGASHVSGVDARDSKGGRSRKRGSGGGDARCVAPRGTAGAAIWHLACRRAVRPLPFGDGRVAL